MSSYIAIASQTLGSGTSSVTFSDIPTTKNGKTLRDLIIIVQANDGEPYLRFNSDSATNYIHNWMLGTTTGASSGAQASQTGIALARVAWGQSAIGQVFDFAQTNKHKTVLSRANVAGASTNDAVEAISGRWASTSAITSLTIYSFSATNFSVGSTFSLYGIEG